MKVEQVNVTDTDAHEDVHGDDASNEDVHGDDACKTTSIEIYLTKSTMNSTFLTAKDGYALSDWIIDSGASLHASLHKEWFISYVPTKDLVKLGNEQTCEILGVGDVQLKFQNGSSFMLKNVRHIPSITKSLISTRVLDDALNFMGISSGI